MGDIKPVIPVKMFCGMIATDNDVMEQGFERLVSLFGSIDEQTDNTSFGFTDYYADEMGVNLIRKFVSFTDLIDPGEIVAVKLATDEVEKELAIADEAGMSRRINMDPGYITPAKVVLATTKDFAHRIYLSNGIYAEVTLNFRKGKGQCDGFKWTYPDFGTEECHEFLLRVRRVLLNERDET